MKLLPWFVFPLLTFGIIILVLNIQERDYYDHGISVSVEEGADPPLSRVPTDGPYHQSLILDSIAHFCVTCGQCVHSVVLEESRRSLSIIDEDGWYRLFWSYDDTYSFEDPVYLAEAMRNPTARSPLGHLSLRYKVGPALDSGHPDHPCDEVVSDFTLYYILRTSDQPVDPKPVGPLLQSEGELEGMRETSPLLSFRYDDHPDRPPVLHYYWQRVLDGVGGLSSLRSCACGKP